MLTFIDLTLELYDGLLTYPGHPPVSIAAQSDFETSAHRFEKPCEGFSSRLITFSDHSGTHVDAAAHFMRGGATAEAVAPGRLVGKAMLLDATKVKAGNEPVSADTLDKAEAAQGMSVAQGETVLIRCWEKGWGEDGFFAAPALDPSAGEWFEQKQVNAVGLDLSNIDVMTNMRRDVHLRLLGKNILILENLVNLDKLPLDKRFGFMAVPLALRGTTASPVRALAFPGDITFTPW